MAEAWLRALAPEAYESLSAGARPSGSIHPVAAEVMLEVGISLAGHSSKDIRDFLPPVGTPPDVVVSVCDRAAADCPVFPGQVSRLHWPFEDPAAIVAADERLRVARCVRDEIRGRIEVALESGEFDGS